MRGGLGRKSIALTERHMKEDNVIRTLLVAVSDGDISSPAVCSVGTGVVLNSTAALESGAFVQEGSTVDGKWPVGGIVLGDRRSSTAEVAFKRLYISGCQDDADSSECTKSQCVSHVVSTE